MKNNKKIVWFILGILLFSTINLFYINSSKADGESWLTGWTYRKEITVSNKIADYATMINVTKSSGGDVDCEGHCNDNFSDLRFTQSDGETLIPHWIDELEYSSGSYAHVWVNNTNDEATLYMYYGNVGATSTSSGDDTFIVFSSFENEYDDGWSLDQGGGGFTDVTSRDGSYSVDLYDNGADAWCVLNRAIDFDFTLNCWLYMADANAVCHIRFWDTSGDPPDANLMYGIRFEDDLLRVYGDVGYDAYTPHHNEDSWYFFVFDVDISANDVWMKYREDGSDTWSYYNTTAWSEGSAVTTSEFWFMSGYNSQHAYFDAFVLKPWTTGTEPSFSFGSEETEGPGWTNSNPSITADSENPPDTQTDVTTLLANFYNHFNISVTDDDNTNQSINVTWRAIVDSEWKDIGSNASSECNSTFYCNNVSWIDSYNTEYTWSVNVSDNCTSGKGWSNQTFTFTTIDYTPDAPTITGATADSPSQITITWTDDDEADSTYIEWDSQNDDSWNRGDHNDTTINATSGSESHTGLSSGTTYYYKAWSWNASQAIWSSGSNIVSAKTRGLVWHSKTFGGSVTVTGGEAIDCELNSTNWIIGELGVGNSAVKNFKFWQNGTANIDVEIGVSNINFTFVNYTDWDASGFNQFCANFTNDSWVTETNILTSPFNGTLKYNFAPGNFDFGVRIWMPKTMSVESKREDFEVILTVTEHT